MSRPLYQIAQEIGWNWKPVGPAAYPYLRAMYSLNNINDNFGLDSGKSVVLYFLSNAASWRGDVARRIKSELKELAGVK